MSKAIILYGPPGSGKGTYAALLVNNFDFTHFDTGRYIRKLLYDSANQKDEIIQREKKFSEKGMLCTPVWVLKIISQVAEKIAAVGWNVVFSGSPRTIFEAFGRDADERRNDEGGQSKKTVGLMSILANLYGKENIFIFELKVKPQTSIKRNTTRVACAVCGQPSLFLYTGRTKCCAFCAGPFEKRKDDNIEVIKTRLREYQERTRPILKELAKEGYKIFQIDGEPAPYKVYQEIIKKIK